MAELTVQIADELYQRLLQQIRAEGTSLDQLVERALTADLSAVAQLDPVITVEAAADDLLGDHDLLPGMFDALTAAGAIWEIDSTAEEALLDKAALMATPTGEPRDSFAVAKDIATALQAIAQQQGVSTQTLINLWLQEKLWQLRQ